MRRIRNEAGVLMATSLAAVTTLVALGLWHLRIRRHPSWFTCPDGRFYITVGYPAVVIAVYWLMNSTTVGELEWVLGNLWTLGAMTAFVYGFNALNAESERQTSSHLDIESIPEPQTSIDVN
jgi:hypothetical protein